MSKTEWLDVLGWSKEQLQDISFVGFTYIKQGKWDIALAFFEALYVLDPSSTYTLQTLGALYLQKSNNFKALNFIEKALKADPLHEPSLLNKAKALFALGFRKQALAQARQLISSRDKKIANQAEALILAYS